MTHFRQLVDRYGLNSDDFTHENIGKKTNEPKEAESKEPNRIVPLFPFLETKSEEKPELVIFGEHEGDGDSDEDSEPPPWAE